MTGPDFATRATGWWWDDQVSQALAAGDVDRLDRLVQLREAEVQPRICTASADDLAEDLEQTLTDLADLLGGITRQLGEVLA